MSFSFIFTRLLASELSKQLMMRFIPRIIWPTTTAFLEGRSRGKASMAGQRPLTGKKVRRKGGLDSCEWTLQSEFRRLMSEYAERWGKLHLNCRRFHKELGLVLSRVRTSNM